MPVTQIPYIIIRKKNVNDTLTTPIMNPILIAICQRVVSSLCNWLQTRPFGRGKLSDVNNFMVDLLKPFGFLNEEMTLVGCKLFQDGGFCCLLISVSGNCK